MIGRETRMLLRHYLEQGVSKSVLSRKLGISRDTIHRWIRSGELNRDLDVEVLRPKRIPRRPSKLDPYKPLILARLEAYPELSAVRLFEEVRAAGYPAGYEPRFHPRFGAARIERTRRSSSGCAKEGKAASILSAGQPST